MSQSPKVTECKKTHKKQTFSSGCISVVHNGIHGLLGDIRAEQLF
jgi:hypothetical protein